MNKYPTIVAIATPLMKCAIHLIRISGSDAYQIINKITDKNITKQGYKIQHVNIIENKKIVDEVLIMKYIAPKSYTGEDMIEITCHGSVFIANKIIKLLIINGAKQAKHGEFTKRAFLNNKLNLLQAEGINNLVNSNSDLSLTVAHKSIDKSASKKINNIIDDLFAIIGKIEINIDYPEYDSTEKITKKEIKAKLDKIISSLKIIVDNSIQVIPYVNGINVAIVGKPNVGKSSLLNAILKENKVIVSEIPGTTRDVVQYSAVIKDITYNFIDTAGIHKPTNEIEQIGIKLSKKMINNAQLILFVIDGSKPTNKEDDKIFNLIKNKNYITVINKTDVKTLKTKYTGTLVSAKNKQINNLIKAINKKAINFNANVDIILPSQNDINLMQAAIKMLQNVLIDVNKNQPLDLTIEDLKSAHNNLLSIIGKNKDFDLINELFKKFCIGK